MFDNDNLENKRPFDDDCEYKSLIEKFLTICLPVTTTPKVKMGKVKTECCGAPIISPKKHDKCCEGMEKGCCNFTIIQKMKVEIPIDFDANTKADDVFVDCELRGNNSDCCDGLFPPKCD